VAGPERIESSLKSVGRLNSEASCSWCVLMSIRVGRHLLTKSKENDHW